MSFLPLTNNPAEIFNITVLETVYIMRQIWNTLGFWALDIRDVDNNSLVLAVKLVTKTNVLAQYANLPFDLRSEILTDPGRFDLEEFNLEVLEK